jgi:cleavage stimulation factor subunit 3
VLTLHPSVPTFSHFRLSSPKSIQFDVTILIPQKRIPARVLSFSVTGHIMAEYNAEMAFLESLKGGADVPAESSSVLPPQTATESPESSSEDEDYDPSDVVTPAALAVVSSTDAPGAVTSISQQNSGLTTKQPRTRGGFVIDDEDEEEPGNQDTSTNGTDGLLNGAKVSSELLRSLSGTPSNAVSTPDANVPILKPETLPSQDSTALTASASHPPSDARATSSTPVPRAPVSQAVRTADPAMSTTLSLPKVRLPQDRVGILEDRVAEDPRGDMDAWLELIGEHRNRNRLDDAREVYDRFFKVFPSAVRPDTFVIFQSFV